MTNHSTDKRLKNTKFKTRKLRDKITKKLPLHYALIGLNCKQRRKTSSRPVLYTPIAVQYLGNNSRSVIGKYRVSSHAPLTLQ